MNDAVVLRYIDPGTGFTVATLGGWLIALLIGFLGTFAIFFKAIFRFIKRHKRTLLVFLLIIIGLGIIGLMIMQRKESKFENRVIILGFDGLSPEIIEPMISAGKLPNFSALKEQGSYRKIQTTNPSQSPVAWSGFATGQNPGKNGVFDFIVRDPKTYGLDLSLSGMEKGKPKRVIKSKCFWQYASEEQIPNIILACPVTYPPDKIYGRMLSGMGVPDILGTEGTFTFYTSEAIDRDKDIGGKVFQVRRAPEMTMELIGPRVAKPGKTANVTVPFKVALREGKASVAIEYQKHKIELAAGQWSPWQEVTFNLDFFKKAKGIFKFYLIETEPEFKLYISPINFDPREPFFQISYPESYSKDLADALGLYYTQGMPMQTWAVNEKRITEEAFLSEVNQVLKEKTAMLDFELNRFQNGVLFCYFESPDIIQHMFWRYIDPQHPLYEDDAVQEYKQMIEGWYKKMDGILGSVLTRMNGQDTLIVLSDHGFDTFRRAAHVNSWLRENGYLRLKNQSAESGSELLADIDWSQTRAYAIGFGAVYVNQQGREGQGIVKPGRETELLKEEISERLENWIDEKYNQPVVNKVYKREEIFWGDYADQTPDLYIGFNIGYRASWQTAIGGVPAGLIEDNLKKWSGSHLFDPNLIPGVIFSNKRITKETPSLYDIAPTILKIAGYDDERLKRCDFDGKPLF
ncbi:alkaline phosphatase family protein [Candidatus Omnitrophota bacterium]